MDLKLLHPPSRTFGSDSSAQTLGSSMSASQPVEILRTSPYGVVGLAVPVVDRCIFSLAHCTFHSVSRCLLLWKLQVLIFVTGISKCYGSDCTVSALHNMFFTYVRPSVKVINDTLKAGGDPKTLELQLNLWGDKKGNGRSSACFNSNTLHVFILFDVFAFSCIKVPGIDDDAEISKQFGSHATAKAIWHQFNGTIKPNAQKLKAASERGDDPKDVILVDGVGNHGRPGRGQTVRYCTSCTSTFSFCLQSLEFRASKVLELMMTQK